MASLQTFRMQCIQLLNFKSTSKLKIIGSERLYSVFNPQYVKPVVTKEEQKKLEGSGEIIEILHLPVKPAFSNETSSEFYDPIVNKFINYLTREGKKQDARNLIERTFENIKCIQLEKYNKANPEEQQNIELDPKKILHKAVENSTPVLELTKMKRGGHTYQVPVPLSDKRATFLGMNWLIRSAKDKHGRVRMWDKLATELIDAHNNEGRVVKKKQDLYRQCEANRSYAHFRWS